MKILCTLLLLVCTFTLAGCNEETPVDPTKPATLPEEPRPFKETKVKETLSKLEFTTPLKGDEINPNGQNYAKAIRLWMEENPDRKIISLLGQPHFDSNSGLKAVWLITRANGSGEKQRVVQLDLPTELPEEYTIATLIFSAGNPSGILGVTP